MTNHDKRSCVDSEIKQVNQVKLNIDVHVKTTAPIEEGLEQK